MTDGLDKIAPLLKKVYEDSLTEQLNRDTSFFSRVRGEQTPEELERIAAAKAKREDLIDLLNTATGIVKAIVELHSTDAKWMDECNGCDFGGYEGDKPAWPCRTIELIAEELKHG